MSLSRALLAALILLPLAAHATEEVHTEFSYADQTAAGGWRGSCQATPELLQSPRIIDTNERKTEISSSVLDRYKSVNLAFKRSSHGPHGGYKIEGTYVGDGASQPTMPYDKVSYKFKTMHFHATAEHAMSDNRRRRSLEMHLVHESETGAMLVIAVVMGPYAKGEEDPLPGGWKSNEKLEEMLHISNADLDKGKGQVSGWNLLETFDSESKTYYRAYKGSLTTPPCTAGVVFLVVNKAAQATRTQGERFKEKIELPDEGNARLFQWR